MSTTTDYNALLAKAIANGPPYPPRYAAFGGSPHGSVDIGVSALFIGLFAVLGIFHMRLFKSNRAKGHMFIFSAVIFGFCMSRVTTYAMRISTIKNPTSIGLAIAANVLLSAGVILLFITNLNFAQRILRGYHPNFGRSIPVKYAFLAYYISIVLVLIMVIVATVMSFNTLDANKLNTYRDIQHVGVVYFTIFSFLPIPIVLLARFIPGNNKTRFGTLGTMTHKVIIVVVAAGLLTLENSFRAATTFLPLRPLTDPAWYDKRAAFYVFSPTLEVLVVFLYAVTRVDQRLHEEAVNLERKEDGIEMGSA